jgi:hypothetical protein
LELGEVSVGVEAAKALAGSVSARAGSASAAISKQARARRLAKL